MIFAFLRRRAAHRSIAPLYDAMMARSLDPQLFLGGGIPDTFEGRFEAVTLHAALVLRRLKGQPSPAEALSQDLVNRIFDGLDAAMREVGISDVGVPKRMKFFAQGFYGRLEAYSVALEQPGSPDRLADALTRNVLEGAPVPSSLLHYVISLAEALDSVSVEDMAAGRIPHIVCEGTA